MDNVPDSRFADTRQIAKRVSALGCMMVIEILFVVCMFLWFLANLPVPQVAPYTWANSWLAFIAVLLLGVFIFMPGMR